MRITVYTSGSGTHTTRSSVLTAYIEAWGAGGAGGGVTGSGSTNGGGAGGQESVKLDTVTGETGYAYSVAATTTGSAIVIRNGADTTWRTTVCVAKGGAGVAINSVADSAGNPGASGSTADGVGDTVTAGGDGGTAPLVNNSGGGGGGGGGNASGATAGTATAPGGNGGAGRSTSGVGNAASAFGGGGGGAYAVGVTDRAGGDGGAGGLYVYELDQRDLLCLGCG